MLGRWYVMMTIKDLAERFGISEKSVRRRLDSLSPVISQHLTTGRQNAILLTDSGVSIFDRLIQLERQDKLSPTAAAERVKSELQNGISPMSDHGVGPVPTVPNVPNELVEVLTRQVEDLRSERDRLLSIIEEQGQQIRALMPGPTELRNKNNQRLTRWQALKVVLLGNGA